MDGIVRVVSFGGFEEIAERFFLPAAEVGALGADAKGVRVHDLEPYESDRQRIGRMRQIFSDQSAAICRIREIRGLSGSGNRPRIERM
jgi:hypothetical protein